MNPLLLFSMAALALCAVVVAVLGWSAVRAARTQAPSSARAATLAQVAVYREQLAELEREHVQGSLSDADYEVAREELTQRLLQESQGASAAAVAVPAVAAVPRAKGLVWVLAVAIPVCAVSLYLAVGQPLALDPAALSAQQDDEHLSPERLASMATTLQQRLQEQPTQVEGWVMLARVQRARELYEEANQALQKALALRQDPDLDIERAEILAQKNGGAFEGEPWTIILRVLKADPQHGNALLLAGSAAFSEARYKDALLYWERVQKLLPADSPDAAPLADAIGKARDKLGLAAAASPVNKATAGTAGARVSGRVTLSAEAAAQAQPQDVVFIYATPVEGSRMPLAIVRTTVAQLPYDFVLDDGLAMNPQAKLSSVQQVTVRARLSRSGNAMAQSGDWSASVSPVPVVGGKKLELRISELVK